MKNKPKILKKKVSSVERQALTQLQSYAQLLTDLKHRIQHAQVKASLSVNKELVLLYWHIGNEILKRQVKEGWGAKIIDMLSYDLSKAFPNMKGFSRTNLKYMSRFAQAYPDILIGQQLADQLPWFHNIVLLEKIKDVEERLWYAEQTIEHGWSRNVLVHQIESDLFARKGKAITNFKNTLLSPQSELAQQLLKDPYTFDFLTLTDKANERALERGLTEHIKEFLLELGVGFAFVGSQYHLEVGDEDFYIDLLFYHTKLHCFVVIDLKMEAFKPEFSGKMNFYLSAVDGLVRQAEDHPSIGIILCKSKNKLIAEYALKDTQKPIGVSSYKLTRALPKNLKGNIPTIAELEAELFPSKKKLKNIKTRNRKTK